MSKTKMNAERKSEILLTIKRIQEIKKELDEAISDGYALVNGPNKPAYWFTPEQLNNYNYVTQEVFKDTPDFWN